MLSSLAPERGQLLGEFPYVRVGRGETPLIVFPGVGDAIFDGRYTAPTAAAVRGFFTPYLADHTLYLLSRPRSFPDGYSIGDMAHDYARAIEAIGDSTNVLGISMGGFIGQKLAVERPDLVRRLVLAVSGRRLASEKLSTIDRWQHWTDEHDWASIRADLTSKMFFDWRRFLLPALIGTVGRPFVPRPADPYDVQQSLAEIRAFDSSDWLDDIHVPTLVIGGKQDPFFPANILETTADGIPSATLRVLPSARHGAFQERKLEFDDAVRTFLTS